MLESMSFHFPHNHTVHCSLCLWYSQSFSTGSLISTLNLFYFFLHQAKKASLNSGSPISDKAIKNERMEGKEGTKEWRKERKKEKGKKEGTFVGRNNAYLSCKLFLKARKWWLQTSLWTGERETIQCNWSYSMCLFRWLFSYYLLIKHVCYMEFSISVLHLKILRKTNFNWKDKTARNSVLGVLSLPHLLSSPPYVSWFSSQAGSVQSKEVWHGHTSRFAIQNEKGQPSSEIRKSNL